MTDSRETAAPSSTPVRRQAPRWMWIVMTISLALNLLVVGFVGATAWAWHRGAFGPGIFRAAHGVYHELPAERRREVRAIIAGHHEQLRERRRAVRAARNGVAERLGAEKFDRAAFETALKRLHEAELAKRQGAVPMLGEIAQKLTVHERRAFLHAFRRWHRHHEPRGYGRPWKKLDKGSDGAGGAE